MDVPYGNQVNKAWATQESFKRWAEEWIYGVDDWEGYCQKIGWDRLIRLARAEQRYQKYGEVR